MYKIIKKELLAPNIYRMDIAAPRVACSAKPGSSSSCDWTKRGNVSR